MARDHTVPSIGDENTGPSTEPGDPEVREARGWKWRWPFLSWTGRDEFRAVFDVGFVVLLVVAVLFGWAIAAISGALRQAETPVWAGLAFAGLMVLGMIVHELAHVLGYRLVGAPWSAIAFTRNGAEVYSRGRRLTPWRLLIVAALGPVAELGFGVAILCFLTPWTAGWIAGLLLTINSVFPLLSHSDADSDQAIIWQSICTLVRRARTRRSAGRAS